MCDAYETRKYCGACDAACTEGQLCSTGTCVSSCPSGTVDCDGKCVDPQTDLSYCGAKLGGACDNADSTSTDFKGEACSSGKVCSAGACATSCLPSQVLCNGKCVDPQTDVNFCGAATGGQCDSADSALVDFQGIDCPVGQLCAGGTCQTTCLDTQALCGGKCVDPETNLFFCGATLGGSCDATGADDANYQGVICEAGQVCTGGECLVSCLAGQVFCGGKCVDPATDNTYCGATLGGSCDATDVADVNYQGVTCEAGEVCSGGVCGLSCGGDTPTLCGDACVDVLTNNAFCGADAGDCSGGVACGPGEACVNGQCDPSCAAPLTRCADACVDTSTDPAYCGSCTRTCAAAANATAVCVAGGCDYVCNPGFSDCDGDTANGCELEEPDCIVAWVEYGPVHNFQGMASEHFITQGSCSVGTIDENAAYFCHSFYGSECFVLPGYVAHRTPSATYPKMHKVSGCTTRGVDIPDTDCSGQPCHIGNWSETTSGVGNIICLCPQQ